MAATEAGKIKGWLVEATDSCEEIAEFLEKKMIGYEITGKILVDGKEKFVRWGFGPDNWRNE